MAKLSILKIWF